MKIILFLFFVNILLPIYFYSEFAFRRMKTVFEIPSPPGINGEILFRNLYALYTSSYERKQGNKVFYEFIESHYPSLSSLYNSPIANRKFEVQELEKMGISFSSYSEHFEKCVREIGKTSLWDLFGQQFLHVLNTSGDIKKVIRLVQCITAANYIAGESTHRIERDPENWYCGGLISPIDYHLKLFTPEGKSGIATVDDYYEWEKLDKEDRRMVMAFVYIILAKNEIRNIKTFLAELSEYAEEELSEIRTIIESLYIEEGLKQKVLKIFP